MWFVVDSKLIDLVIDDSKIPADSPIGLNTSKMQLLFPNLTDKFSLNKGIYVKVQA